MSERRACRALGQHRSAQRKVPQGRADEKHLTDEIIELADRYGRYGYRMVTGLLNNAGWHVNHKRVERIWRREGLKVPQKQKKKGRLWLNDGSCVRLRPERPIRLLRKRSARRAPMPTTSICSPLGLTASIASMRTGCRRFFSKVWRPGVSTRSQLLKIGSRPKRQMRSIAGSGQKRQALWRERWREGNLMKKITNDFIYL